MILVKVSLKMLFGAMVVYSTQPSLYVPWCEYESVDALCPYPKGVAPILDNLSLTAGSLTIHRLWLLRPLICICRRTDEKNLPKHHLSLGHTHVPRRLGQPPTRLSQASFLPSAASSNDSFLFSSDIKLIDMYLSFKRIITAAPHGFLYLTLEFPYGFLTLQYSSRQFQKRTFPFFFCRYFEGYVESVDKREFYLVEHASAGNALVILTACTTARIGISVIAIIGMTAFLAFEAVCPLYRGQVLKAWGIIGKTTIKFDWFHSFEFIALFHACKSRQNP